MNVAAVKYVDVANGPGCRTSVFVAGCTRGCPGCFNAEAWDFEAGERWGDALAERVVASLRSAYVSGLTVLGGEPMEPRNQPGVLGLLRLVRGEVPGKTVWLYTGDTLDELLEGGRHCVRGVTAELLGLVDVLVDGPYVEGLHDVALRFRGSSNQRLIYLPQTLAEGRPVLWRDEPVYASHGWA